MEAGRIEYRLDLILRLTDAATGEPVRQGRAAFREQGRQIEFQEKEDGVYILQNHGRESTWYEIYAGGYEPEKTEVRYDVLDERYPAVEVELLPEEKPDGYPRVWSLTGSFPGLKRLDAVSLYEPLDTALAYNEKKRTLKLQNGLTPDPCDGKYALLSPERERFEELSIMKNEDRFTLRLKDSLSDGFVKGGAIARIIPGKIRPPDGYVLRLKEKGAMAAWLIRYVTDGEKRFQRIDFKMDKGKELKT